MHSTSLIIAKQLIEKYVKDKPLDILDLGSAICGDQDKLGSYKQFFNNSKWNYIGADIVPGRNVNIVLTKPYNWEFEDNSFDVIISGQVIEHIEYPFIWFVELARILKVGGICIVIAPAVSKEHRCPVDTFRYYPDGMRALAKWSNLEVLETELWPTKRDCYMVATK